MPESVGILAYGSLIGDPGKEIKGATVDTVRDVLTPFSVEFARTSSGRRGAPTLVPVTGHGAAVNAHVFVLDVSVDEAADRLYRRERGLVGTAVRYMHPEKPGANHVIVRHLEDFSGLDTVLYAEIGANIENLNADVLAELAIASARGPADDRDGITYLMGALSNGINTPLSGPYNEEILMRLDAADLAEALAKARAQGAGG
jgi:hypothetical protein